MIRTSLAVIGAFILIAAGGMAATLRIEPSLYFPSQLSSDIDLAREQVIQEKSGGTGLRPSLEVVRNRLWFTSAFGAALLVGALAHQRRAHGEFANEG